MGRTRSGLIVPGPPSITRPGLVVPGGASFDPLTAVAWARAFWTEGPEFRALGLADGAAVSTIPCELTSASMTQPTGSAQPTYRSSSASFANRPIVEFDGTADFVKSAVLTTINQPFTVVVVGRLRSTGAANRYIASHTADSTSAETLGKSTTDTWRILGNNGSANGGTSNTAAHLFRRVVNNFADTMHVDETLVINSTGNIGTTGFLGVTLAARGDGAAGTFADLDWVFYGVKAGSLSAGEIAALRAWSQQRYGTP